MTLKLDCYLSVICKWLYRRIDKIWGIGIHCMVMINRIYSRTQAELMTSRLRTRNTPDPAFSLPFPPECAVCIHKHQNYWPDWLVIFTDGILFFHLSTFGNHPSDSVRTRHVNTWVLTPISNGLDLVPLRVIRGSIVLNHTAVWFYLTL